jgi:nitrite reductase/ring-hydroxylating ferredoxin subunit
MTDELRRIDVAAVADLREGTILPVQVDGVDIILVNAAMCIRAFQGICTHEYYPLAEGALEDGRLTCALHFSTFDATTGSVVTGPAGIPLASYPVEQLDGRLLIVLPKGTVPVNE